MEASECIQAFLEFFENNYKDKIVAAKSFLEVSFNDLSGWNADLANELLDSPEDTIKSAELAMDQLGKKLSVWFTCLPPTQIRNIWEIRREDVGPFVGLKGIINKSSQVIHVCTEAKFECPSCGNVINVLQLGSQFKEPSKCGCGRKGKFIMLDKKVADTIKMGLIDDLMEEGNKDRSMAREKLGILSGDDLTSHKVDRMIRPGRKVLLNGYFSYVQKSQSTEFDSIFQVNSIEFIEVGWDTVKVSPSEESQIKRLTTEDNIIERLSESIADVEGYSEVKKACLLQLAGAPNLYDQNKHLTSRGTIHILLIGNPGVSKTFIAKRAGGIAPLNYFQSAANASGRGLVASVAKDPDIDGYAVYPGVVAMAHKGIAIIDEIDKTHKEDYGDHNNAMNDMLVTVAKANVKAKIDAETSYLATANPKNRIFTDYGEPYFEQIDMPKDFQDRFDIIFPMLPATDVGSKERIMDIMLDRHVSKEEQKSWNPEFSHEFIRNYVAYCRRVNPRPKLSKSLFKIIKERLTNLMQPRGEDQAKISFRQLESILRFAYASARLRLRDISEQDIDLAFELKYKSFTSLKIIDSSGVWKWNIEEGVSEDKISDDKKIYGIIKEFLPDDRAIAEIQDIVDACVKVGIAEDKVEMYLEKKKRIGDFIEPRRGKIKKM